MTDDPNVIKELVEVTQGVAGPVVPVDVDREPIEGLLVIKHPPGWSSERVDLEKWLARPRRHQGTYTVNSVASFIDLWGAFRTVGEAPRIFHWADSGPMGPHKTHAVAVFNGDDAQMPGWGDLRVSLELERTVPWNLFMGILNRP